MGVQNHTDRRSGRCKIENQTHAQDEKGSVWAEDQIAEPGEESDQRGKDRHRLYAMHGEPPLRKKIAIAVLL
jgi:hypothetical protein